MKSESKTEKESLEYTEKGKEKPNNARMGAVILSEEQRKQMTSLLSTMITWRTLSMMHACVHCGMCTEACHYYMSTNDPALIPASKLEKVARVFRKYHVIVGSKVPFLKGSRQLTDQETDILYCTAFEDCTLCGRCGMTCPMGINAGPILLQARTLFARIGKLPSGLDKPVLTAVEIGNYVALSEEDFTETLEWISGEMSDELELDDFAIPIDQPEADFLYIPHPLEVRDYPLLITAAAKILNAANESYTFSTKHFDVANYAYYSGHTENMLKIVNHLLRAKEELKAKSVLLSPCGHGYRVLRWEAERNLGYRFPFKIYTFSELIDRYLREGRIRVKKDVIDEPITYHDPCNLARYGGIVEAPRNILRALSSHFVEMEPSGEWNYCCGGGGGLAATGDYGHIRMKMGKVKADQIQKTGAKVVVTNCYNCNTQIKELNDKYKLSVKVKSIVEVVADSIEAGTDRR